MALTSCTIIISHFESFSFLQATIRQIRKFSHSDIKQHIIICDQSGDVCYSKIVDAFGTDDAVTIIRTAPLYSGYGIDFCMRYGNIETDYVCQLHVDAFPIHRNWLCMPIKLIEEYGFAFVGQLHNISNPTDAIYPPNSRFFCMSPTFNVAKTETYRELALQGGFTRFHNRTTEFHNKIPMDGPIAWENNDWAEWAKDDYYARGSDDDAVAFAWEDKYKEHNKLGLAVTGSIAILGREPDFGRVIEDVVFHFGSCRESKGVFDSMGELYQKYTKRIQEEYNDKLIEELLSLVNKGNFKQRDIWNGTTKTHHPPSEELNKRIEELKYE